MPSPINAAHIAAEINIAISKYFIRLVMMEHSVKRAITLSFFSYHQNIRRWIGEFHGFPSAGNGGAGCQLRGDGAGGWRQPIVRALSFPDAFAL